MLARGAELDDRGTREVLADDVEPFRRTCAIQLPIAPCLIGSSINRHDNAAIPIEAAIWSTARARSGLLLAAVVSTMTG